MKASTKLRVILIGLALSFYLLLQFLSQFPDFVEQYYSNGLYKIITIITTNLSSQFSFSLSELAAWMILLLGIPFIFYRIRQKRLGITRILLNLLLTFSFFYVWFYLFWGINYLRTPLKLKLDLEVAQPPEGAFDSTFVQIINKANQLNPGYAVKPIAEVDSIINEAYDRLLEQFDLPKVGGNRGLKTLTLNWLMNTTTTSGWFSPFFHEIHYNSDLLIFETPFVIAHEKAHQMGYTSEAEANFLAHLACVSSNDALCMYSGYFQVLSYFLNSAPMHKRDSEEYFARLSPGVQLDLSAVQQRWRSYHGLISKLSNKGYDLYLKANNVAEGIHSYSLVVDLLTHFYYLKMAESQEN